MFRALLDASIQERETKDPFEALPLQWLALFDIQIFNPQHATHEFKVITDALEVGLVCLFERLSTDLLRQVLVIEAKVRDCFREFLYLVPMSHNQVDQSLVSDVHDLLFSDSNLLSHGMLWLRRVLRILK